MIWSILDQNHKFSFAVLLDIKAEIVVHMVDQNCFQGTYPNIICRCSCIFRMEFFVGI